MPLLPADTELIGGLELGGVPLATIISSLTGLPALFVRKEAKTYGTCKLAEGPAVEKRTITLIEDIITTGGAVRKAAEALRERDAQVHTVVCAINRSDQGDHVLDDTNLTTIAGMTKDDLDRLHDAPR